MCPRNRFRYNIKANKKCCVSAIDAQKSDIPLEYGFETMCRPENRIDLQHRAFPFRAQICAMGGDGG